MCPLRNHAKSNIVSIAVRERKYRDTLLIVHLLFQLFNTNTVTGSFKADRQLIIFFALGSVVDVFVFGP